MVKIMAILRTIFLAFMLGYAVWATPWTVMWTSTAEVPAVGRSVVVRLLSAFWVLVLWVGIEVVVGWVHVWVAARLRARGDARAAAAATPAPKG